MTSRRSTSAAGEAGERDAPDTRQLVDQLGDGVGDADADRGDVEQVDPSAPACGVSARDRRHRAGACGVEPCEQVGRQAGEALVGADTPGEAAVGVVGEPRRTRRRRP